MPEQGHAAATDPLYPAFVLLVLYGMRRGEVLGLRWQDVDVDAGLIQVRQQVQRIQGELYIGPVKTRAGNRDLPLIGLAKDALAGRRRRSRRGDLRASQNCCWRPALALALAPETRPVGATGFEPVTLAC